MNLFCIFFAKEHEEEKYNFVVQIAMNKKLYEKISTWRNQ